MIEAVRDHEICIGHRVVGQGGKCEKLHGHNLGISFFCQADLNEIGMVLDYGHIKTRLCDWLEENWDHRFLMWSDDPWLTHQMKFIVRADGLITVPFNPTSENIAEYLLRIVGPIQLQGTGVKLAKVIVQETSKCYAIAEW